MRLLRLLQNSLLTWLLILAAQKICAQLAPADSFFNSGAQFYISNNIPAALERTESGLKVYPDDMKLKKLEQLLKQQQQQQSQQNQQQQNQQSQQNQNKSKQQNSDEQKNQSQQDQQKSQQEKQQNQQQQPQNPEQKNQQQSGKEQQKPENQNGQEQDVAAGKMTPEEAKRLLDSQKDDERVLQFKPEGKPPQDNRPIKDW